MDSGSAFAWEDTRLVVFDVDGTLYRQRSLRLRMLRDLLWHSLRRTDSRTLRILRTYRKLRESYGEREVVDFEAALIAATAREHSCTEEHARRITVEWIDERPLPYLPACMYPNVAALFTAIRASGRLVGILSDYPAAAKLEHMGLSADHIVCAVDPDVGVQKPNPRGLERLIMAADATPEETVLIGDRAERDGLAARRAGAKVLLRSERPIPGWRCFSSYTDSLFQPLLGTSLPQE